MGIGYEVWSSTNHFNFNRIGFFELNSYFKIPFAHPLGKMRYLKQFITNETGIRNWPTSNIKLRQTSKL